MKTRFLFILVMVILLSCSKEDEVITTYTIVNNIPTFSSDIEYLDGSLYNWWLQYYEGENEASGSSVQGTVSSNGGETKKLTIKDGASSGANVDNIRICFQFLPDESEHANSGYNIAYYSKKQLDVGEHNIITINANTIIYNYYNGEPTTVSMVLNNMDANIE